MAYSFRQLEGLWIQAGGNRGIAPVMAAIALAESGGNPNATGGVGEKGLWQINPHAWGSLATYDPLGNAKAAVHVLHVQGLSAWSTYNNGSFKQFLQGGAPTGTGQGKGTTAGSRGSGGVSGTPNAPNPGSTKSGQGASTGLWGWLQAIWTGAAVGADQTQIGQDIGGASTLASDFGGLGVIAQAIAGLTAPFVKIGNAIDWLFIPSHWVRIFAGLFGVVLVPLGLVTLVHGTREESGGAAVAIGIAETGTGAVLLVVAFHNLPSTGPDAVNSPGELLGYLQGRVQADISSGTSPATATTAAGAS